MKEPVFSWSDWVLVDKAEDGVVLLQTQRGRLLKFDEALETALPWLMAPRRKSDALRLLGDAEAPEAAATLLEVLIDEGVVEPSSATPSDLPEHVTGGVAQLLDRRPLGDGPTPTAYLITQSVCVS